MERRLVLAQRRGAGPNLRLLPLAPRQRLAIGRRTFLTMLGGCALAWSRAACAQEGKAPRRIGVLMALPETDAEAPQRVAALRDELRSRGWTEGDNLWIEWRWAPPDSGKAGQFASELVAIQPDVLFAQSSLALTELTKRTRTIPIIFTGVSNPVERGFISSLARPGGNATGFAQADEGAQEKLLDILWQLVSKPSRVGYFYNPQAVPNSYASEAFSRASLRLGAEPFVRAVRDSGELSRAMEELAKVPQAGLILSPDTFITSHRTEIMVLAARHRVPAIYPHPSFSREGALISYGTDQVAMTRNAAAYLDRVLRGERPADLPVQAPATFALTINLKTAKALGMTFPPSLLARADEVIE